METKGEIGAGASREGAVGREVSDAGSGPAGRAWWQVLVEQSPDVVAVFAADLRLLYANPALEAVLGYRPEELVGRSGSLLDRADEPRVRAVHREVLGAPGHTTTFGASFRHRDGTMRALDLTVTNLLHEPNVRGLLVYARDVTDHHALQRALEAGERRIRTIVDDQSELVCRYFPDLTITFVNRAFVEFYGGTEDSWVGESLERVMSPAERAQARERLATFAPGEVRVQQMWEVRHDGALRWFEWTDRALADEHGTIVEFQSVGRDVHEQFLAESMLATQAHVLELVARRHPLEESLGALAAAIRQVQPHCRAMLHLVGDRGLRMVAADGIDPAWAVGVGGGEHDTAGALRDPVALAAAQRFVVEVRSAAADPRWAAHAARLEHDGVRTTLSLPLMRSSGDVAGVLTVLDARDAPLTGPDRRLVDSLARLAEIAIERRAFEDELARTSLHDPLTGLPNRSLLLDRLDHALARARRARRAVAVLFLDLDGFKLYNDSLGHAAGDRLLVAMAARLRSAVRPADTVARFGGDEFVILCEDLDLAAATEEATAIAARVLGSLAEPFPVDGTEAYLLASIGIAVAPATGVAAEDLLRDADAAMYHAKEQGRGRFAVFDDAMRVEAQARHATISALHGAVGRGELAVHYQPIVDLASGAVAGAEALARWDHPVRGILEPHEFVPLAETSDLIVELGTEVLLTACRQAARWQEGTEDGFTIAVNLAARQLAQPQFVDHVAAVLRETGLPPERLCLEMTESALLRDVEQSAEAMRRLEALGVRLAIDDFGTGYSSLSYLQRFPARIVKIDRSFVAGLGTSPSADAIVVAVLGLARTMDLEVVAEGVETAEQLAALRDLGCDRAQGFYFAPPLPAAEFETVRDQRR